MELDYGYIRAVTPYYSVYDITIRGTQEHQKIIDDDTFYAKIIKQHWRSKGHDAFQVSVKTSVCKAQYSMP